MALNLISGNLLLLLPPLQPSLSAALEEVKVFVSTVGNDPSGLCVCDAYRRACESTCQLMMTDGAPPSIVGGLQRLR